MRRNTDDVDIYASPYRQQCTPAVKTSELLIAEPAASEALIPSRSYVVPGYFQRGMVTELIGPGGAGKGQITAAWSVALALGLPFGSLRPTIPMRVMVFSAEDDLPELQRRIAAVLRWFGKTAHDLDGRLQLTTSNGLATLLGLSPETGKIERTVLYLNLIQEIASFTPDLLILDPLAELHDLQENDNTGLRVVGSQLRLLAQQASLAVLLVHHTRKGPADPGNPDAGRGASSLGALVRKSFTLFPMTKDEAKDWSINDPHYYFRLDGAKANHDSLNATEWFTRIPIELDNGDVVARCEPWTPPRDILGEDAFDQLLVIVAAGKEGSPWSQRLGRYDRSISQPMARIGITTRHRQEEALAALFNAGVEDVSWIKLNRTTAFGLRHPNGRPNVKWVT